MNVNLKFKFTIQGRLKIFCISLKFINFFEMRVTKKLQQLCSKTPWIPKSLQIWNTEMERYGNFFDQI